MTPSSRSPKVLDLYLRLAILGIEHLDIRHASILCTLDIPPGWPGVCSSFSGMGYRYRSIDFERSCKTNWSMMEFREHHYGWATRLLNGLERGLVLEIADF